MMVMWRVRYSFWCMVAGMAPNHVSVTTLEMIPLRSWSLAGEFVSSCNSVEMEEGVSCVRVTGLIVGEFESFPPFLDRIKIVSRIIVRCIGVTRFEAYTVIELSSVSGKSPERPSQKERPHNEMLSFEIVVSAGVGLSLLKVSN